MTKEQITQTYIEQMRKEPAEIMVAALILKDLTEEELVKYLQGIRKNEDEAMIGKDPAELPEVKSIADKEMIKITEGKQKAKKINSAAFKILKIKPVRSEKSKRADKIKPRKSILKKPKSSLIEDLSRLTSFKFKNKDISILIRLTKSK